MIRGKLHKCLVISVIVADFRADAFCSLVPPHSPDSPGKVHSWGPGHCAHPVYLQLSPEVRGSHPHFPTASNGKQKPRRQTLGGGKNKNITSPLGKKELDIRNYLPPPSGIGGRVKVSE